MTCKAILAYEDTKGQLHKTEKTCCASNVRIEKLKNCDKLMDTYIKLWPKFLDFYHPAFAGKRGDQTLHRFLKHIIEKGYIIVEYEK